jgi:hypothetical protein
MILGRREPGLLRRAIFFLIYKKNPSSSGFAIVAGCKFHQEAMERVVWYAPVGWCLTPFRCLTESQECVFLDTCFGETQVLTDEVVFIVVESR